MTETAPTAPLRHADGVYLDLPIDDYVRDRALSGTGLKKLPPNPPDWWWEHPDNPLWDEPESDARALGTLVHVAVLEGIGAYEARYCVEPNKADHPGALETNDELKQYLRDANDAALAASRWEPPRQLALTGANGDLAQRISNEITMNGAPPAPELDLSNRKAMLAWLRARNEQLAEEADARKPKTWLLGGGKEELVKNVLEANPDAPLWDRIVADIVKGRTQISAKVDTYVRLIQRFVAQDETYAPYLTDGLPEVSVFWTEDGVRKKARWDLINTAGIVDLKKFGQSPRMGRTLLQHVLNEAARYGYDVQAVHNVRAARFAALQHAHGDLEFSATGPDASARIEKCSQILRSFRDNDPAFRWLFVRTPGAPTTIMPEFGPTDEYGNDDLVWQAAERKLELALDRFNEYRAACGDEMWLRSDGVVRPHIADWPLYATEVA